MSEQNDERVLPEAQWRDANDEIVLPEWADSEIADLEKAVVEAAIKWRADIFAEPHPLSGQNAYASYVGLLEAIEALLKAREKEQP